MLADDQIRILSSMLICIPLSYIIPKIPNPKARQLYSFLMGTIIQYFIYGKDILLIFVLHLLVYLMIKFSPKNCGKHVTIVSLGLLSIYHIYRMIVDYGGWNMDISTIMMSNVNKYSLFAYAYQDGQSELNKLSKQQLKQRIEKLPSFYRFLGYCQFLPCSPIGTAFPYKYFEDYMQLENQYKNIPSPWRKIGKDVGISLVLALVYVLNMFLFPLSTMQQPQYAHRSFWFIIYYSFFCVTTLRFKYYFAWKLSMGAIHASGISYQVHGDGTSDFKLIQNCNPLIVQTTVHTRQKIANWNMSCQQWLRKCVYERSHYKNKFYSQLITFMVSAFWHGFYGGYYLSFLLWFVQVYVSQLVYKESKKQNSKWIKMYKSLGKAGPILLWIASNVTFTVSGTFFQVLSLRRSFEILRQIYFAPAICYAIVYFLFTFGATRQEKKDGQLKHKISSKQSIKQSEQHKESDPVLPTKTE